MNLITQLKVQIPSSTNFGIVTDIVLIYLVCMQHHETQRVLLPDSFQKLFSELIKLSFLVWGYWDKCVLIL